MIQTISPLTRRKPKLLLTIPALRSGGAERVLSLLANHWVTRGHEVVLVTLAHPTEKPFYPLHQRIHLIQLDQLNLEKKNFLGRLWNILQRIRTLRQVIKQHQPNLIVSFLDTMNIATLLAARGFGLSTLVCERVDPAHHPLPAFYSIVREIIYPWASQVLVQTNAAKSYFKEPLQRKITVIPNSVGVATERHRVRPDGTVQKIATVGRLAPQKDHPTLIRAFSTIAARFPDLVLTLYGDGPDREHLTQLIHALGMQNRIHLPGVISNIDQALAESDLFVFPSRYEGFPNALCEAMAVGLPVIASNCSGNVDVVQEGIDGRLFPVGNETILAERMAELITDAAQRERLAKGALEITNRFQKSKILKAWDQVIEENHQKDGRQPGND